jgi:hypothetical protein
VARVSAAIAAAMVLDLVMAGLHTVELERPSLAA